MEVVDSRIEKQRTASEFFHISEVVINNFLNIADFLGKFDINHSQSDDQIEAFAIVPSSKNPRWIIPLKNKALFISSLTLYQPSLVRAKLLKKMTVLAAKGGLPNLAIKNRVYFQRKDGEIKKIFKRDALHYAFFTGTEGCHRKITVQVMGGEGTILGYIKVSDNEDIDRLLKNEAEILGDLLRLEIRNGLFPKVIYHGHINDVNILVLDTLKSVHSKFSSKLSECHINFLSEILVKTSKAMEFRESGFAKELRERIAKLDTGSLRNSYEMAADFIEGKIGNIEMPFGFCHRDFTPWNIFFHNDKLYVFDWEYAKREYPPLIDIFHFIVQDGIMVRHLKADGLVKRVLKHRELLSEYSRLVGIKESLLLPLLLCYLLDISLLYIEREKGNLTLTTSKNINIWKEMMEGIVNSYWLFVNR
jgi:thiamine kinase-like enzyme